MKIINNAAEFKSFYFYKSPPNKEPCPPKNEYPKKYPCIVEHIHEDGGMGGDYVRHKITYFPEFPGVNWVGNRDYKIFFEGYKKGRN